MSFSPDLDNWKSHDLGNCEFISGKRRSCPQLALRAQRGRSWSEKANRLARADLTESAYAVVLQKAIPAQIRSLILYISNDKLKVDVSCYADSGDAGLARAWPDRCQAQRGRLQKNQGLQHESQGQKLALAVLCMPYSLGSGLRV